MIRILTAVLVATLLDPAAIEGQCGDNQPAEPVPECRDPLSGDEVTCGEEPEAVRLWPDGFRPAASRRAVAGESRQHRLPDFHRPGLEERSRALPVPWMSSAITSMWSKMPACRYGTSPATTPKTRKRQFFRDGWQGLFLEFPPAGENDFFVRDVDAIDSGVAGRGVLVAVAGERTAWVPRSWEHTVSPAGFVQHYQDLGGGSRKVRVAELAGSVYAFAAGGGIEGVFVYDVTAAADLETPCLDLSGSVCPGIFLGEFATNVAFLDLVVHEGRILLAAGRAAGLRRRDLGARRSHRPRERNAQVLRSRWRGSGNRSVPVR